MSNVLQSAPATGASRISMPAQVGWALKLLWLGLAINAVPFWWHMLPTLVATTPNGAAIPGLAMPFVTLLISVYLNVMIARRKNWARITKLVLAVVNLLTMMFVWRFLGQFQSIKIAIAPALEFTALYLLFASPGRLWFRPASSSKEV